MIPFDWRPNPFEDYWWEGSRWTAPPTPSVVVYRNFDDVTVDDGDIANITRLVTATAFTIVAAAATVTYLAVRRITSRLA